MAIVYARINDKLRDFIKAQHMFFVGTAPLSGEGHVNLSPKGLDCLRILSPLRVAYLDLVGSGNETSAHLMENGRITFMFCAFEGDPKILRLYGRGHVVLPGEPEWEELVGLFPPYEGKRQLIVADITRVQTSCGFGVPLYRFEGDREHLPNWLEGKGPTRLETYKQKYNLRSIDGLPSALNAEYKKDGKS